MTEHPALRLKRGRDDRLTPEQAGYMELVGAVKDADCHKVRVPGGVSQERGCCNKFEPFRKTVKEFECGQCEYLKGKRHKEPDHE